MFINRTSFKNLKTTWRPSLKTMVEESLNSLNFLKKASWLTIWKKLEQFIATSFTLKKASHNGFVSTCIAFGKKNVEKTANTWRKLKLHLGLFVSTPSCEHKWRRHKLGIKLVFGSQSVQKPVWHPIIFFHKVFTLCCCSLHPLSGLNWPFRSPMAPTL